MDKLSVLFAFILAAVVLRENVTWHHWLGGGLVLAGAVVLAIK
jgi:transporter family protein